MKKLTLLFLLFSLGASAQRWTLVNNTLTIQIKKNTATPVQVGKWLSNFAIVGDSVSVIWQRNPDNSHFTYYIDKDSVISPVMASATALYDTLVKWTINSTSPDISLKVDSVKRKTGSDSVFYYRNNGTQVFAFRDSIGGGTDTTDWNLLGNTGTSAATNFIGTIDNISFVVKTNNTERVRVLNTGNVGIGTASPLGRLHVKGVDSLVSSLPFIVTDDKDTVLFRIHGKGQIEAGSHQDLLPLSRNLSIGWESGLNLDDSAQSNVFIGFRAGQNVTDGHRNTLIGSEAGATQKGHGAGGNPLDSAYESTFVGYRAGFANTAGFENTFVGVLSGTTNTTGNTNAFFGLSSGMFNTTGDNGTFLGVNTGLNNTTGDANTYIGSDAGRGNISSNHNVMIGFEAGFTATGARCVGIGVDCGYFSAGGNENTLLGYASGFGLTGGSSNLCLGARSGFYGNTSNTVWIDVLDRGDAVNQDREALIKLVANADSSLQTGRHNYILSTLGVTDLRKTINTTAGDAATIDAMSGRFRKDTSGSTFTLTNALVTANSIIDFDLMGDLAATGIAQISYTPGAGSVTITFYDIAVATGIPETKDPAANQDVSFSIIN